MKLITQIITIYIILLGACYSQGTNADEIVKKTNIIMYGIFEDVLAIKDKYKELEKFTDYYFNEGYKMEETYIIFPEILYSYYPNWHSDGREVEEKTCNPQSGCLHFKAIFMRSRCTKTRCYDDNCPQPPAYQVYIPAVKRHLLIFERSGNSELDKKLLAIFKKNTKDWKVEKVPWN
jgi:hypothetical protein